MEINRSRLAAAVSLATGVLLIYLLRLNGVAGMVTDDAWYVLLAQSLAAGSGFKVISSPSEAILPLYPPGFPALLSFMFRADTGFPDNVWLLKSVSIAAMIGVGFLTHQYLRARAVSNAIATSAAVATVLTPAFVFLATSTVMSECVFALTQLGAVLLVHRSGDAMGRHATRLLVIAAIIAAAAVLIRTAAVTLVAATVIWLVKERRWRQAFVFAATVSVCVLPWIVYSTLNAPTRAQRVEHGGAVAYSYGEQLWMRWAGSPQSGTITAWDLPERIVTNTTDIFTRGMIGLFAPVMLRGPNESGEEVVGLGPGSLGEVGSTKAISLVISAIVLAGFITIARRRVTVAELLMPLSFAVIVLWPFWSFRFLVPLTPYLFFYLVSGLQLMTRSMQAARIVTLSVIGLFVYDHAGYIFLARSGQRPAGIEWLDRAREVDAILTWVRENLRDDGAVASTNPALLYLRTGRRSMDFDNPGLRPAAWKQRGFRYIVCLRPLELPGAEPGSYKTLYRSSTGLWVIEL